MALTTTEIEARIDALVKALAMGQQTVIYGTGNSQRQVTFRSVADIRTAISALRSELAAVGGARSLRTFRVSSEKGL